MSKEYRIFGPPGVGKTTTAAKNIKNAAEKYGAERVMVCSFTKAAAQEIGSRDIEIPKENIGTLHAIAWRALGKPKIAETDIKAFNAANPNYALGESGCNVDEPGDGPTSATKADEHFSQYQLYRARRLPQEMWPIDVRIFAEKWENWKREASVFDFNDLIEVCLNDVPIAPGSPDVIFVDESQDLSSLQFALARKWSEQADQVVFIGDDQQAIYRWTGADPENLINDNIPVENKIFLKQSYRVPRAVHSMGNKLCENLTRKQPKDWKPRDADGEIGQLPAGSWQHVDGVLRTLEAEDKAGRSVMLLASCSYMLTPIIKAMRDRGILFHNEFRKTNGAWNPIRTDGGSTYARIKAFIGDGTALTPSWTARELALWTELIDSKGVLRHGAKKQIEELAVKSPKKELSYQDWLPFFEQDPWGFDPPTLNWLVSHMREAKRKVADYPLRVLKNQSSYSDTPQARITVGTVHSVKGGEADCVVLYPDLSRQGWEEWRAGSTRRDDVIRMFYVGLTRAREKLLIAKPATGTYVNLMKYAQTNV